MRELIEWKVELLEILKETNIKVEGRINEEQLKN
jgi:hypothetical protein